MCLGGHLAFRCALDARVAAAVCYFATDLHSATLGAGKSDDSLRRAGEVKGELVMVFGKLDNHVPPEGRDRIRRVLHEEGVVFSWFEPAGAQREFFFFFFGCFLWHCFCVDAALLQCRCFTATVSLLHCSSVDASLLQCRCFTTSVSLRHYFTHPPSRLPTNPP